MGLATARIYDYKRDKRVKHLADFINLIENISILSPGWNILHEKQIGNGKDLHLRPFSERKYFFNIDLPRTKENIVSNLIIITLAPHTRSWNTAAKINSIIILHHVQANESPAYVDHIIGYI